jgi:hypothetical protein
MISIGCRRYADIPDIFALAEGSADVRKCSNPAQAGSGAVQESDACFAPSPEIPQVRDANGIVLVYGGGIGAGVLILILFIQPETTNFNNAPFLSWKNRSPVV